jgi:hypothetical protein
VIAVLAGIVSEVFAALDIDVEVLTNPKVVEQIPYGTF